VSSTLNIQAPSNEEATCGKHYQSLTAIEASANSGCRLCMMHWNSNTFHFARCQLDGNDNQQISYESVRTVAVEENRLGLIELHFKFGDQTVSDRGAVVLVPSKGEKQIARFGLLELQMYNCK
jgi:hypothetical protein